MPRVIGRGVYDHIELAASKGGDIVIPIPAQHGAAASHRGIRFAAVEGRYRVTACECSVNDMAAQE